MKGVGWWDVATAMLTVDVVGEFAINVFVCLKCLLIVPCGAG